MKGIEHKLLWSTRKRLCFNKRYCPIETLGDNLEYCKVELTNLLRMGHLWITGLAPQTFSTAHFFNLNLQFGLFGPNRTGGPAHANLCCPLSNTGNINNVALKMATRITVFTSQVETYLEPKPKINRTLTLYCTTMPKFSFWVGSTILYKKNMNHC